MQYGEYGWQQSNDLKGRNVSMKYVLKAIAAVLAIMVLAALGFWIWCRAVNHRSFMAGFVDLFLKLQHRSDKFTYADKADEYIESKAMTTHPLCKAVTKGSNNQAIKKPIKIGEITTRNSLIKPNNFHSFKT